MVADTETAPETNPERLQKRVRCSRSNAPGDTPAESEYQVSLEDIDALIDASHDYERALARKSLMQRRFTLNLIIYRDELEAFGKAVWRGAV